MKILSYRAHKDPNSALVGFFELQIPKWGGFIIRGMKVFQKSGRRWVNFPSEKYEQDGQTKYAPLNKFDDQSVMDRFQTEVLKAIDAHLIQTASVQPKPVYDDETVPF